MLRVVKKYLKSGFEDLWVKRICIIASVLIVLYVGYYILSLVTLIIPHAYIGNQRVVLYESADVSRVLTNRVKNSNINVSVELSKVSEIDFLFAQVKCEDGTYLDVTWDDPIDKIANISFNIPEDKKGTFLVYISIGGYRTNPSMRYYSPEWYFTIKKV